MMNNCFVLLGFVLVASGLIELSQAELKRHEVFLPPDTDVLTVVGKGFKLELSQFEQMRNNWKEAATDSANVETPKTLGPSAEAKQPGDELDEANARQVNELAGGGSGGNKQQQNNNNNDNANKNNNDNKPKDYGFVDEALKLWIDIRATALIERLDRYHDELSHEVRTEGEKVVVEVLQLNTLTQLEDLEREQLPFLGWLSKKLHALANQKRFNKFEAHQDVSNYVWGAMKELVQVEARTKMTNDPGKNWLTNGSRLRRVTNEQRFAASLDKYILDFMAREFSMMKRNLLLDILVGTQQVDNGLVYWAAKGRVPTDFPFSAQDAIANGALY